jgi:ATP-dependent RNA helicase RhlE
VHRIGRTARAGAEGIAISLCDAEEKAFLRDIEKLIRASIPSSDRRTHRQGGEPAQERPAQERHAAPRNGAAKNGSGRHPHPAPAKDRHWHRGNGGNGGRKQQRRHPQPSGQPSTGDAGIASVAFMHRNDHARRDDTHRGSRSSGNVKVQ